MNTSALSNSDIALIVFNIVVTALSFYAAWINLVEKRFSRFGFDAILLFINRLYAKKQVDRIPRTPKMARRSGLLMLLFGLGGIDALIDLWQKYFTP